jgi:DNA ligase-associated metallophosphoesterase
MYNIEKNIKKQTLYFDYRKAVFWKEEEAIIIADLHIGKIMHFRKNGSAIPNFASSSNLSIIKELVQLYQPKKIIFLGDLFHSSYNSEWEDWIRFFKIINLQLILISGNHDHDNSAISSINKLKVFDQLICGPFSLTHYPSNNNRNINLCGHIHPSFYLNLPSKKKVKVPCFVIKEDRIIFPAFGAFTGTHQVYKDHDSEIFAIGRNRIFNLV